MSFLLPKSLPPAAESLLGLACFAAGYDQTPSPTAVRIEDGRLIVTHQADESASLFLPWPVGPVGAVVTATSTLRERPEPYHLAVELARGKLNQVRMQTADWREIGLETPADYDRELQDLSRQFGTAALNLPSAESEDAAARVLAGSFRAADQLAHLYADQMFATRRQDDDGQLIAHLSARYASPPSGPLAAEYRRAFTAARIGFRWRDVEPVESSYNWEAVDRAVEAARVAGLPIVVGPLIDLSPGMLPAWTASWEGDLQTLAAFMCDYLETFISRYRDHVRSWVVCSGCNHADGAGLTDDERLRLVQRLFEAALQLDSGLDLAVGIAQPWGDYLRRDDQTISPLAFADDLIRTGLRVSAIELEIRNGSSPRGSLPRDLLDASRMLDMFSMLGLPIEVVLSHPTSVGPDPLSTERGEQLWTPAWSGGPTPDAQADWGASFAELALCKHSIRGLTWDHWSDADPHLTPCGGLIDAAGNANPLLARFQAIRVARLE